MQIVAVIHRENGAWGISFPDLPGCVSAADSRDELLANAQEALALHLWGMADTGERLPPFRSEAALRGDPHCQDDFADAAEVILVRVPDTATPMTTPQAAE